MAGRKRRKLGRPSKYVMPPQIDDTPENVMRALVNSPPRKPDEWRFMQDFKRQQEAERATPDADNE